MQPQDPTYRESVQVGWALYWRAIGSFTLLLLSMNGLLVFLLPELTRTGPPLWVALLPFVIATICCTFLVMPYVVRLLLRASFHGFHLQLIRDHPPQA